MAEIEYAKDLQAFNILYNEQIQRYELFKEKTHIRMHSEFETPHLAENCPIKYFLRDCTTDIVRIHPKIMDSALKELVKMETDINKLRGEYESLFNT